MDQFLSAVRNITWLWNRKSHPIYTHLDLDDGKEGESRCENPSNRRSSRRLGHNLRRSAAVISYLILSVTSLTVSFYMDQRLARNEHERPHLQSDLIWGESKSPYCWHRSRRLHQRI